MTQTLNYRFCNKLKILNFFRLDILTINRFFSAKVLFHYSTERLSSSLSLWRLCSNLSVTETTSPPMSQFPQLFTLYSQLSFNNHYLILINFLFIDDVSIQV